MNLEVPKHESLSVPLVPLFSWNHNTSYTNLSCSEGSVPHVSCSTSITFACDAGSLLWWVGKDE